jgi:hypothetical protein
MDAMRKLSELCELLSEQWKNDNGEHSKLRRRYLEEAESWLRKAAEVGPVSRGHRRWGCFYETASALGGGGDLS